MQTNDMISVAIKPLHPEFGKSIPLPQKMSLHASGFDVAAAIDEPVTLEPLERQLIPCGFAIQVPVGFEAQIRPRSGLANKHGIGILNAPGTIDADYRGEVKVLLVNLGNAPFVIEQGMRIAQLVIAKSPEVELRVQTHLDDTARGERGFGSTGLEALEK